MASRDHQGSEHWTKMIRSNMECRSWSALSLPAQAIYPWLKLEWKGPRANNNGRIQLSLRQIAKAAGCDVKTAMRAIRDLQRKGWIVVREAACIGVSGAARSHLLELTEIACPPDDRPRALFRHWREDAEYPVVNVRTNNPSGRNQKQNPVPLEGTTRSLRGHKTRQAVPLAGTGCSSRGNEQAENGALVVPLEGISLSTRGSGG